MYTGWIIASSIILFLVLILLLPFHLDFSMVGDDVIIYARVLFIKYVIYPEKVKKKKKKDKIKPAEKSGKKKKQVTKQEQISKIADNISVLTKISGTLIRKLKKHLVIRLKDFEIVVATGDAAKTAIVYGGICGGLSALFPVLYESMNFKISQKAKGVSMDFTSEDMIINFDLDFCVNLLKAVLILLPTAMEYIKIKSKEDEEEN